MRYAIQTVWKGENNLLRFNVANCFVLKSCLTFFYRQVLPETATYSDKAMPTTVRRLQVEGTVKIYVSILEVTPEPGSKFNFLNILLKGNIFKILLKFLLINL